MYGGICIGGPYARQYQTASHRSFQARSAKLRLSSFLDLDAMIPESYVERTDTYRYTPFFVKGTEFGLWIADSENITAFESLKRVFKRNSVRGRARKGYGVYELPLGRWDSIVFFQPRGLTIEQAVARALKKYCRKPRKHPR